MSDPNPNVLTIEVPIIHQLPVLEDEKLEKIEKILIRHESE